jgi:hypothetical protein
MAFLEHHDPVHSHFIIQDVDGKYRGLGIFEEYILTPGSHTIRLSGAIAIDTGPIVEHSLVAKHFVDVSFNAESGKRYVIDVSFDIARKTWGSFIVDKETGNIVSTMKEVVAD